MTDNTTKTSSNKIEDVNIDHDDFTCEINDDTNTREISLPVDKSTESIHHNFYKKRSTVSVLKRNTQREEDALCVRMKSPLLLAKKMEQKHMIIVRSVKSLSARHVLRNSTQEVW